MKRFLIVIISLFCALTVSAVSYGSPYRGLGHSGYVYATSHASTAGLAQAPVASMNSTSSRGFTTGTMMVTTTRAVTTSPRVRGIYTSASAVKGGVTTYNAGAGRPGSIKRANGPGVPEEWCEHCIDDGTGHCAICGCEMDNCDCEPYCRCPLTDGWQVWLMMAVLAAAYAVYKKRTITVQ